MLPKDMLLLLLAIVGINESHADHGSSLVEGLFGRHVDIGSSHVAHEGKVESLARTRVTAAGPDGLHMMGFKQYMNSMLLPHHMLQEDRPWPLPSDTQGIVEPDFSEMKPSVHSSTQRVPKYSHREASGQGSLESIQAAIAAFKRTDAADVAADQQMNVFPVQQEGQEGGEETEQEAAKKKKEWMMLQEILRLQTLLKEEKEKRQHETEWVKQQNLRNEEWALKKVAQAKITHIKNQAYSRVTKAEVVANKALAAQHFTVEATAIRSAIDHLRMHRALDAVNTRYEQSRYHESWRNMRIPRTCTHTHIKIPSPAINSLCC